MILNKPRSYRKPVDQKCRSCTYDSRAVGTWRQQVTLCSVTKCPPCNTGWNRLKSGILQVLDLIDEDPGAIRGFRYNTMGVTTMSNRAGSDSSCEIVVHKKAPGHKIGG